MVLGYGYNEATGEIIFDDTSSADRRMAWNGTYQYAGHEYHIQSVTTVVLDTEGLKVFDKTPPTISLTGDTETPLQSASLTAATDEEAVIAYSLDNQVWTEYAGALEVTANGTYYFKATDASGNTGTAEITFANIDAEAPVISAIAADKTAPTNQPVTVTASFSDNVALASKLYRIGDGDWTDYLDGVVVTDNATVAFRAVDTAGNETLAQYEVGNIDKTEPEAPVASADITVATNQDVTVTAVFSDDSAVREYSLDGMTWQAYTEAVKFTENGSVSFRGTDEAGNVSAVTEFIVGNIDKTEPEAPVASADVTIATNGDVLVSATFSDDSAVREYSLDGKTWQAYTEAVKFTENGSVSFRGTDEAGNASAVTEFTVGNIDKTEPVITLTGDNQSSVKQSSLAAESDDGSEIFYSVDNQTWTKYEGMLEVTTNGTYYFKATDAAGNTGTAEIVFANILPAAPDNLSGTKEKVSWEPIGAEQYVVEYSTDNFAHVIRTVTSGAAIDLLDLPAGTYQWRVRTEDGEEWAVGEELVSDQEAGTAKIVQSNEDGVNDIFFATPDGTWETLYHAKHVGSVNDWAGTGDLVAAKGKGRIRNLFFGSADPNVLCLTDTDNGDALFIDDVYTELPEEAKENTARLYKIQEIRAGAGNDIVDMTSQRFEYTGDGVTIRGGDGNDTIWANKGDNFLFGDAGKDRIVGASGNDVIAGGIGNDSMHGGGGNDLFTFCRNWGADTVEQLASGTVTLWFASGSIENWNAETLTYADGNFSVTVSGVSADKITLKFGDDGSAQFAALSDMGAFNAFTSRKIFEESGNGMLAGV